MANGRRIREAAGENASHDKNDHTDAGRRQNGSNKQLVG